VACRLGKLRCRRHLVGRSLERDDLVPAHLCFPRAPNPTGSAARLPAMIDAAILFC
jgi:hypothetical protein